MTANEAQVVSRLLSLVAEHSPEGLVMDDINPKYYKIYGTFLSAKDYDFNSLYDLYKYICEETQQSLVIKNRCLEDLLKTDRIFFDEICYKEWIRKHQKKQNISFLESMISCKIPKDIAFHKQQKALPSLPLPSKAFDPNYIQIMAAKLTHVESPNEIYIHLLCYNREYKQLREDLRYYDAYYGDPKERYVFPIELAVEGYHCVVKNPNDWYNWHRAVIIGYDDVYDIVTVFAIDFGNIITENRNELRLMKNEFLRYPPLAIKVSLAGISPIYDKWNIEATTFIQKFITRFCAEFSMACAFLYPLAHNYYEVLLGYKSQIIKEGIAENIIVYLHEKLISRNLANIKIEDSIHYDNCIAYYQNELEFQLCSNYFVETEPIPSNTTKKYFPKQKADYFNSIDRQVNYFNQEMANQFHTKVKYFNDSIAKQFYNKSLINKKVQYFNAEIANEFNKKFSFDRKAKYFTQNIERKVNNNNFSNGRKGKYFNEEIGIQFDRKVKYFTEDMAKEFSNDRKVKYFTEDMAKEFSNDRKVKYFTEDVTKEFSNDRKVKYFTEDVTKEFSNDRKVKYFTEDVTKEFSNDRKVKYFNEKIANEFNQKVLLNRN